jgi:hypothetical protein
VGVSGTVYKPAQRDTHAALAVAANVGCFGLLLLVVVLIGCEFASRFVVMVGLWGFWGGLCGQVAELFGICRDGLMGFGWFFFAHMFAAEAQHAFGTGKVVGGGGTVGSAFILPHPVGTGALFAAGKKAAGRSPVYDFIRFAWVTVGNVVELFVARAVVRGGWCLAFDCGWHVCFIRFVFI